MNEKELLKQLRERAKEIKREFVVDRETINEENRTVEFSVASGFPVERWFGFEILDVNEKSIRMARLKDGAAIRDTHYGDVVAVVRDAYIKDGKLRVLGEFSKNTKRADEIFGDVRDGIRKNVSMRYAVHKIVLEKEEGDVSTYRVTDWEPIHVSIEPDPADPTVGVGRSKDEPEEKVFELKIDSTKSVEDQIRNFNEENKTHKIKLNYVQLNNERNASMNEEEKRALVDAALKNASVERSKEIKNIFALARNHSEQLAGLDLMAMASEFVEAGKTSREFTDEVILKNLNNPEATRKPNQTLGMDEDDVAKYSIRNLILSFDPKNQDSKLGGYERSISDEFRKKNPDGYNRNSMVTVPPDVILKKVNQVDKVRAAVRQFGERVLTVGTATAGGNLVGTNLESSSFIELARNKTLAFNLGVQFVDGLVGNVAIPVQLTAGTVEWLGEDTAASASDLTIGQRTASPKNASSNTSFSRNLLLQSTPAIDFIVENDLRNIIKIAMDKALFEGSGSSNQPRGVRYTTGINDVVGSSFGWADVVEFETDIMAANLDVESMAYVMPPSILGICKVTERTSGNGIYLFEDGQINGYPVGVTTQISAQNMGFGDWSQAMLLQWGGVDFTIDPFYYATTGKIRVIIFVSMDVVVKQPAAFSWSDEVAL